MDKDLKTGADEMTASERINKAANTVSKLLDTAVFVYSGQIDRHGYGALLATMEASEEQPFLPNSLLFLTTHGGYASQAYRIARIFQRTTGKFYLCIPSYCKSAGTLIALGATELFLAPAAELGPLDVQLHRRDEIGERRSGMVVRTALAGLAEETYGVFERVMLNIKIGSGQAISFDVASRIAATIATGVMAPIYAQIDPELLGSDLRDLAEASSYGERLVKYGRNATDETVRKLVEDYPTHGFIIDREEATNIFNKVPSLPNEITDLMNELGGLVYRVHKPHYIARIDGKLNHKSPENDE